METHYWNLLKICIAVLWPLDAEGVVSLAWILTRIRLDVALGNEVLMREILNFVVCFCSEDACGPPRLFWRDAGANAACAPQLLTSRNVAPSCRTSEHVTHIRQTLPHTWHDWIGQRWPTTKSSSGWHHNGKKKHVFNQNKTQSINNSPETMSH